jgi:hypothetical protein
VTTAKKAAPAKKAAASRSSTSTTKATDEATQDTTETQAASDESTDASEADAAGAEGNQEPQGKTNQDFGPGTINPVAPPEDSLRPPATIVNSDPTAAPLDPPADHAGQLEPRLGYDTSTTDQAFAESANRTIAGENHLRLVDDDDNELSADDLFEESDPSKTYDVTATKIWEVFTFPNTHRESKRLMYCKGARVPLFQAARIKAAVAAAAEAGPVTSAASQGAGTLTPSE